MKSFAESHPKHEFFKSQAIAGKTTSHLLHAFTACIRQLLLFHMGKMMSNIQHFFQC